MPAKPDCRSERVLAPGVEGDLLERREQAADVGHLDQLQRLAQALADDPVGHPVGEGEDVAVDVLLGPQLRRDLVEVGVVVVDVLGVGHGQPGLLLEGLEGRVPLARVVHVEVGGPVGPPHRLLRVGEVLRQLERGRPTAGWWRWGAPCERRRAQPERGEAEGVATARAVAPPGARRGARGPDQRGGFGIGWRPKAVHEDLALVRRGEGGDACGARGCARAVAREGQLSMLAMTCLMRV